MRAAGGAAEDELSRAVAGEVVSPEENRSIASRFGLEEFLEHVAAIPAKPKEETAGPLKGIPGVLGSKGEGHVSTVVAVEVREDTSQGLRKIRKQPQLLGQIHEAFEAPALVKVVGDPLGL
jgi:hypothetical protein